MAQALRTTDHDEIMAWIEARGGKPAMVKDTRGGNGGILRIDFGEPNDTLEEVTWEEFFDAFEDRDLAFLYQEEQNGAESRFYKFVARDEEGEEEDAEDDEAESDEEEMEDEDTEDKDESAGEKEEE